jgi:hypothetical protein
MTSDNLSSRFLYRLELPLTATQSHQVYGTLVIIKDGSKGTISHYSLKRIEHFCRAVAQRLAVLAKLVISVSPVAQATDG